MARVPEGRGCIDANGCNWGDVLAIPDPLLQCHGIRWLGPAMDRTDSSGPTPASTFAARLLAHGFHRTLIVNQNDQLVDEWDLTLSLEEDAEEADPDPEPPRRTPPSASPPLPTEVPPMTDAEIYCQLLSGRHTLSTIIPVLMHEGRWFAVEPWPEDQWRVSVKAEAKDRLAQLVTDVTDPTVVAQEERYRQLARERFEREGEIEIDEGGPVSHGVEEGAYVQAWLWIPNPESDC